MKRFILALLLLVVGSSYIIADSDSYKKRDYYEKNKYRKINISKNELYIKECGSCHMAYQAEFLPKRSWTKMMDNLDNHFEVDATLEKKDEIEIRVHLKQNASNAKYVHGKIGKLADSAYKNSIPLSISKLPKFIREHDEISNKLIIQKEVRTISNCTACHTDAKEGIYREKNIYIPNYGKWDD